MSKVSNFRLAVSLFDIDNLDAAMRVHVLGGKLNLKDSIVVDLDRKHPTPALTFCCDVLTSALALDVLRSECRRLKERILRAYLSKGSETWYRLPDNAVLTLMSGNKAVLNPKYFGEDEEELLPLAPIAAEKIILGRK